MFLPLYLLAVVVSVTMSVGWCQEGTVSVTRRGDGDSVSLSSPKGSCRVFDCSQHFSYLVEDRKCVKDTTLQTNCNVQLVPWFPGLSSTGSISAFIADNGSLMVLDSSSARYGVGRLHSNGRPQGIHENGSCIISNLTVVRGLESGAEITINHQGFSIEHELQITININDLPYEGEDYDGEVFRVDFNCDNNYKQEDCVFFKLNGTADITKAKFDGNVTERQTDVYNCPTTATITPTPPAEPTASSDLLADPILRYMLYGTGGGVGLLLCLSCCICVVGSCCYSHRKHM